VATRAEGLTNCSHNYLYACSLVIPGKTSSEARMLKLNALMVKMDALGELRENVELALTKLDLALDDHVYELRTELDDRRGGC
jgi:hypothetical protein